MKFEIVGKIEAIETIAVGSNIRVLPHLRKTYGAWSVAQVERQCLRQTSQRQYQVG